EAASVAVWCSAADLFCQFSPALVHSIMLASGGIEFFQSLGEGRRVGGDGGIFHAGTRRLQACVGGFNPRFDTIVLALLDVGELLPRRWRRNRKFGLRLLAEGRGANCRSTILAPRVVLQVIREYRSTAAAVEPDDGIRHAIQQIPVVRDEDEGSGELQQRLSEDLECRNIKIVCRLI